MIRLMIKQSKSDRVYRLRIRMEDNGFKKRHGQNITIDLQEGVVFYFFLSGLTPYPFYTIGFTYGHDVRVVVQKVREVVRPAPWHRKYNEFLVCIVHVVLFLTNSFQEAVWKERHIILLSCSVSCKIC